MIEVRSYVLVGDSLVPLAVANQLVGEEAVEGLESVIYLEGALELTINGYSFLDQQNSRDYVVWLWDMIVQALVRLVDNRDEVFSLPDQPVDWAFVHISSEILGLTLTPVATGKTARKVVVEKGEFTHAMVLAGIEFYDAIDGVCPIGMAVYADSRRKLAALLARIE